MEFFFHNDAQALAVYQGLVPNQGNSDIRAFTDAYSVEAFKEIELEASRTGAEPPKNVNSLSKDDVLAQMKKDYDADGPSPILNTVIMIGMGQILADGMNCHAYGTSNEEQKRLKEEFYSREAEEEEEKE